MRDHAWAAYMLFGDGFWGLEKLRQMLLESYKFERYFRALHRVYKCPGCAELLARIDSERAFNAVRGV